MLKKVISNIENRQPLQWLLGLDCDALPYSESKDGYGMFSALAGFALAQSVALTAVARDEKYTVLVVVIYLMFTLVTSLWITAMLRATRNEKLTGVPGSIGYTCVRAFDRSSIRFGRCSFCWTILVAIVTSILGLNQLLPNQTNRIAFQGASIDTDPYLIQNRSQSSFSSLGGTAEERVVMDAWLKLLEQEGKAAAKTPSEKERVTKRIVWIEQRDAFPAYYKPFSLKLVIEGIDQKPYHIRDKAAFLVHRDGSSARATYRQLSFRMEKGVALDTFIVDNANRGEFIVIIAEIILKDLNSGEIPPNVRDYGLKLIIDK